MRRIVSAACLMVVVAMPATAGPDRGSLIAAWEASLRDDQDTVRFEPLGDGRYAYATAAFPFDGTLEISEVVIDDRGADTAFGTVSGHVVAELKDIDDEFRRRHAASLGLWESANTMMWDADEERWLTTSEWSRRLQQSYGGWWSALTSGLFWIGLLVALFVMAWLFSRRANRQLKKAMAQQEHALEQQAQAMRMHEEGLELARESNRLLARILETLENRTDT